MGLRSRAILGVDMVHDRIDDETGERVDLRTGIFLRPVDRRDKDGDAWGNPLLENQVVENIRGVGERVVIESVMKEDNRVAVPALRVSRGKVDFHRPAPVQRTAGDSYNFV